MDLLWRKRKLRRQAEDAVVAARCVEEWLRTSQDMDTGNADSGASGDTDSGETARRWRESGRLDPDAAMVFGTWYRERVRIAMRDASSGLVASQEDGSKEDFESTRVGLLADIEEIRAITRWLKAEGCE